MSLRRLRWLLIPLFAALALAVLVLPPRPLPDSPALVPALLGLGGARWRPDVVQEHERSVEAARARLREGVVARSHGAADVRAARSAGALRSTVEPMVVLVRDREVPEAKAREWLRAAEAALAPFPRSARGGVPVIVSLHSRDPRPETVRYEWNEPSIYRYEVDGDAGSACLVDVVMPAKARAGRGRFDVPGWSKGALLGRCAFYGRWGSPGREVGEWVGVGRSWGGAMRWWYGEQLWFVVPRALRDTLSFRQPYRAGVPWAELACFRGQNVYCAALAGLARSPGVERGGPFYYYGRWSLISSERITADLIRERGPERFATFWTSPLRADSALHLAYGVPAGVLAREALSRRYVPEPPAQPGAGKLLIAGGWVIALGVLAMALSLRREMDG